MEYLSTLDAGFLEAEDAGQHVSLAVGALAVLGGPRPEFAYFDAASDVEELATGITRAVLRLTHQAPKDAQQASLG
jgi:nitroimidazol reductase NimA-like FMN-containing flavoprotein (pyridoxamine 5'-phosphate oxidase superfamily)